MSIEILLLLIALVLVIASAAGKVPEWCAVFVVIVAGLVRAWAVR